MRVISFNANGLRSAARKGFFLWFARQKADFLCVQELKAQEHQLADGAFAARGYHRVIHAAHRPGYSGVAIYSRAEPVHVFRGIGVEEFDLEGRYLEVHFPSVVIVSVYFPSGSSSPARQEAKFRFLAAFDKRLEDLARHPLPFVFCGDLNMAHKPIDLKNWRANQDYPGFTPPERAWLDTLFDRRRFVDAFRAIDARADQYTWWSNRGRAWEKNVGWRIDYQITSPVRDAAAAGGDEAACSTMRETVVAAASARLVPMRASIYKARRFSDHAPLTIDYEWRT